MRASRSSQLRVSLVVCRCVVVLCARHFRRARSLIPSVCVYVCVSEFGTSSVAFFFSFYNVKCPQIVLWLVAQLQFLARAADRPQITFRRGLFCATRGLVALQ